jgi:hypothetical protein
MCSESIRIWNTSFYNPQLRLELNHSSLSDEWKEYVQSIEKYFDDSVKEDEKQLKKSTCNALIKTEYRPIYWNYSDKSLLNAYKNVNEALSVLLELRHVYTSNSSNYGTISLSNYILADDKLNYLAAPTFQDEINPPFKIKPEQENSLKNSLKNINKLDLNNNFQNNLANIYSNLCKLKINPTSFNFKDYWTIFFETLFPNNPKKVIEFIQKCYEYRLKTSFFIDAKCFLSSSLRNRLTLDGLQDYSLDEKTLKHLDLYIPLLTRIKAHAFEKKYLTICDYLHFEFLSDIINELSTYQKDNSVFMLKLNDWIDRTINEVYTERNLETHNNITNDLSLIKLKDDFLYMSSTALKVSFRLCNKNTNSIEDIIKML